MGVVEHYGEDTKERPNHDRAHLLWMEANLGREQEHIDSAIQTLLASYEEVFAEPRSLPPPRNLDHNITLRPGGRNISCESKAR